MLLFALMVSTCVPMPAWPGNSCCSCIGSVMGGASLPVKFSTISFFAVESQKGTAELFANLVAVLDKGVRDSKILIGQLLFFSVLYKGDGICKVL